MHMIGKGKQNSESWLRRESLQAMSLGWDLAVPIFGGVLLGYLLDRWLATGYKFTLGLLMLGIGVGYYNVARFIRRVDKQIAEEATHEQPPEGDGVGE